jgi:hypothetical protein
MSAFAVIFAGSIFVRSSTSCQITSSSIKLSLFAIGIRDEGPVRGHDTV